MPFVRSIDAREAPQENNNKLRARLEAPPVDNTQLIEEIKAQLIEKLGTKEWKVNLASKADYPNYNPNDTLAQIIVDAWLNPVFKQRLLTDSKAALRERGLFLVNPRVITHAEYRRSDNYLFYDQFEFLLHDGSVSVPVEETLLVLPDTPENLPPGVDLIDSARSAMAYTPVGI